VGITGLLANTIKLYRKMITRRKFITGTTAALTASLFAPDAFIPCAGNKLENIGFISGIIGKELKGDWKAVLRQVASFGYTEIETGNFLGDSAESYTGFLKEIGLTPVAGGINFNAGDQELRNALELLSKLQINIAVVYWPWYTGGPFKHDECIKSAERLNYLGKFCHNYGFRLCWHNHDKEFIPMEKGLPFDFLMNNTDREIVFCELDLYWVKKGGGDPSGVLKKYEGRFPILHVKDMAPGPEMDFECPGNGIIDFAEIFREAHKQGIKHYMVERDNVPDGIVCLKSASEFLRNLRF